MKTTNNFEDKLREKFEDFSIPLRDSQWGKMEAVLLERKKSKRRLWLFFSLIGLVGILSFASGYWLSTPQENIVSQAKIEEAATIPAEALANSNQKKLTEAESNIKDKTENKSEVNDNDLSMPRDNAKNGQSTDKGQQSDLRTNSLTSISLKQVEKEKLVKEAAFTKEKGNEKRPRQDWDNEGLNSDLSKRKANPLFILGGQRKINSSFLTLLPFPSSSHSKIFDYEYTIPEKVEEAGFRKALVAAKNSLSAELLVGSFSRKTQVEGVADSGLMSYLPGVLESMEKQIATGSGFQFGLGVRSDVFKSFSIKSGLIYNEMRETNSFEQIHNLVPFYDSGGQNILGYIEYDDNVAPRTNVNISNTISYLQIPLNLRYDKRFANKWRAGLSMGYSFTIPLKFELNYYDIFRFEYQKVEQDMLKLGGSLNGGLHLDYKLTKRAWLGLNYQYAQMKNEFIWSSQSFSFKDMSQRINLSMTIKL